LNHLNVIKKSRYTAESPGFGSKIQIGGLRASSNSARAPKGCIVLAAFKFKKEIRFDFNLLPPLQKGHPVALLVVFDGVGPRAGPRPAAARP
jgi:hypothetical protein